MKKNVLLASVLIASAGLYAQNGKIRPQGALPVNMAEREMKKLNENEQTAHTINAPKHSVAVNSKTSKKGGNQQIAVVSANRISSSTNIFGVLVSQQKPLHHNSDVDILTFCHRKGPYYTTSPANNSGSIIFSWSLNKGVTWDSTCIWASGTNLARYPQGAVYNPPGNTNVNNVHFVGTGPVTSGSGWIGGWFASKPYTASVGGNNTALPSPNMQFYPTASFGTMVYMPRHFFTYTNDGFVRSAGSLVQNVGATTNLAFSPRGMAIFKGSFNAGSFTWSADSLKPPVIYSPQNGNALFSLPIMAWDNSGTIGYAVMIGARQGTSGTMKGMQPIVYKTTNSGATWTLIPPFDFTTLVEVDKRLPIATGNYTYSIPFFSIDEGIDATVDAMGRLHLVCTVVSAYSDHIDSLFYTYAFNSGGGCGAQNYNFYYGSTTTHPTIFDFVLDGTNTWNGIVVDSMATEGTRGGDNTCSQYDANSISIDARIQISRNVTGDKIFYSWTETDTTITGHHFNVFPDLYMKGYDIYTNTVTNKMMVIGTSVSTPTIANYGIFWHYMAPKAIDIGGGTYEIPFTFTGDATFGYSVTTVDHYYVSGAQINPSAFTNPATPLSSKSNTTISKNNLSDVSVYPNPTNNTTQLVVNLDKSSDIHIEILNTLGQVINTMTIRGEAGKHIVDVDLSNENVGVYFYNITTNSGKTSGKIIKQ
ncbi:MAG: T9SS type A sorting domain-containing protein [Bacteroidia bacterium]|nr:T9SS type A sorting domain-containing protein [Bacteroidia bacterium]